MEKDTSSEVNSSTIKKDWHNGPQLIMLAHDHIHGGGANRQFREETGTFGGQPHKVINNAGPGIEYGVPTAAYNSFVHVS